MTVEQPAGQQPAGEQPAGEQPTGGQSTGGQATGGQAIGGQVGSGAEHKPAATTSSLIVAVLLYSLARIALVVVIAALIVFGAKIADVQVPLLVAAVFGVLIALPLGLVLFKSLRLRVNDQISQVDARRAEQRNDLQARLRGEE